MNLEVINIKIVVKYLGKDDISSKNIWWEKRVLKDSPQENKHFQAELIKETQNIIYCRRKSDTKCDKNVKLISELNSPTTSSLFNISSLVKMYVK